MTPERLDQIINRAFARTLLETPSTLERRLDAIEVRLGKLERDGAVMKWALGAMLALLAPMFLKLFLG